ncbi:LysR family transcriptional regulator [Streptomyces sp. PTM05]|uniref:LysR family transcriptional regulator n=1 Tax=Streptantibioticus parmotrematis TaxID=2873249 RepID=A0ABS7R380_9ACTN|nr:LysR family transcriptional regulator [Streptantibioticus parmotrematis]MBY8889354.1 LysR family transcriptional regulator [Streptantibioticus parmotrematis]
MDVHGRVVRAFVVLAEELHFSRAARILFVSQPTLSKQMKALERTLGVPLFVRDHAGVRLAPSGEAFLPHARQILLAWEGARQAVEGCAGEPHGER